MRLSVGVQLRLRDRAAFAGGLALPTSRGALRFVDLMGWTAPLIEAFSTGHFCHKDAGGGDRPPHQFSDQLLTTIGRRDELLWNLGRLPFCREQVDQHFVTLV